MIFYRSASGSAHLPVGTVRAVSLLALLAYPVGALLVDHANRSVGVSLAGYGLILAALLGVALLTRSSLQRIVGEVPAKLDEYELHLRSRAMNLSYGGFSMLVMMAVIYAAIASDHGGWVPASYGQYSGVFWGVFLYATVIPVAVLSWLVDDSFEAER